MRFDLLDEYSTLVPFGLGIPRNKAPQGPGVPAKASKRDTTASFASDLELRSRLLGALRQMVLSSYRNFRRRQRA